MVDPMDPEAPLNTDSPDKGAADGQMPSLSSIMDGIASRRVYSGDTADLDADKDRQDERAATGPDEDAKGTEPMEPPPSPAPPDEGIPEEWDFKPKDKDHKAAELGAKETERRFHDKSEEAARLKDEIEALKRRLEEGKPAEPPPSPEPPEPSEDVENQLAAIMEEIDHLDPYEPDYQKKRARLLAKAGFFGNSRGMDRDSIAQVVREVIRAEDQAKAEADNREAQRHKSVQAANQWGKEAGLEMTEGSLDYKLFWDALARAPVGNEVTLQDQVNWMIDDVKRTKDLVASQYKTPGARAREVQKSREVLEKGGSIPTDTRRDDRLESLGAILDRTMERRRI